MAAPRGRRLARAARGRGAGGGFAGFGKAKSVLIVFTPGGMSQFETFDPKPDAPEEIRGAFGTVSTRVAGLRFGEHVPKLAAPAHRFSLVRSVTHDDLDHGSAIYLTLTGQFHARKSSNPPATGADVPTMGSVLQKVRPAKGLPHASVHVNGPLIAPELASPGQFGGFLGRSLTPPTVGDPTAGGGPMPGLDAPDGVPAVRSIAAAACSKTSKPRPARRKKMPGPRSTTSSAGRRSTCSARRPSGRRST